MSASIAQDLLDAPFHVDGARSFQECALRLFRVHAEQNATYRAYLQALRVDPEEVHTVERIPFLPIGQFRNRRVLLEGLEADLHFTSSGTTEAVTSTHHVPWPALYERSFLTSFGAEYGRPSQWRILALLPAYLERPGSSLVYMVEKLIVQSGDVKSGTWLHDLDGLAALLKESEEEGMCTLLFGVPFALLDLAEKHAMPLKHTGDHGDRWHERAPAGNGARGTAWHLERKPLPCPHPQRIRHDGTALPSLVTGWRRLPLPAVDEGAGPRRERSLLARADGRTGGIDVIDLCNIASCPFISTQDLGRVHADGSASRCWGASTTAICGGVICWWSEQRMPTACPYPTFTRRSSSSSRAAAG
jgi:hypothetical protein